MLSKSRLQAVFEQFLATYPNAAFDVDTLTNFTLQGLFHLELTGFGSGPSPVTGELALTASEVLASKLNEDDELTFTPLNKTTVEASLWRSDGNEFFRRAHSNNIYDVFPLADAMIELARKVTRGEKSA